MSLFEIPRIPASSGALLRDPDGNVLILKPTYKSGWTIPGGVMEADGESPWDACRREVLEETGLTVTSGRLAVVDTRGAKDDEPLGMRFLFDCGTLTPEQCAGITLQAIEISEHRFVPPAEAVEMLRKRVARRVKAALDNLGCVYLEDGYRVGGVR